MDCPKCNKIMARATGPYYDYHQSFKITEDGSSAIHTMLEVFKCESCGNYYHNILSRIESKNLARLEGE